MGVILLTGCSEDTQAELTANSSCEVFMNNSQLLQDEAVNRIATDLRAAEAVTPLGRPNVNFLCAQDPAMSLGDAIAATGGEDLPGHGTASEAAGPIEESDREAVLDAASDALEAILSYDHRTLDADRYRAQQHMTAAYSAEHAEAFGLVEETAGTVRATVTTEIVRSGVSGIDATSASVLAFARQTTESTRNDAPITALSPVQVLLTRDGERWLVDDIATGSGPHVDEADPDRQAAMAAARSFFNAVNTYSPDDFSLLSDRLTPMLTAEFAADFADSIADLATQMEVAGLSSTGDFRSAAVAQFGEGTAEVLVSGSADTSSTFDDRRREHNWLVTLENDVAGWLVADYTTVI